jgi:predicted nucleotidyltransferase
MSDAPPQTRLEQVISLFNRHGVKFIVIGGQAEYIFGSPRVTYDVDLCYERSPENLERLAQALTELNPKLRGVPEGVPFILDARTLTMGSNFTFITPFGDLDILGYVEPIGDYSELLQRAKAWQLGDHSVMVIDLDDLIRIKKHVDRPKDRDSLYQLLAIKRVREETGKE